MLERECGLGYIDVPDQGSGHAVAARLASQTGFEDGAVAAQARVQGGVAVLLREARLGHVVVLERDGGLGALEDVAVRARGWLGLAPRHRHLVGPEVRVDGRILDVERVAGARHLLAEHRNHPRVVPQEAGLGREEVRTALLAHRFEHPPQAVVLGDAAAEHEFVATGQRERALGDLREHREHRLFEPATDILDGRSAIVLLLGGAHDAREREVHPLDDVRQVGVLAVLGVLLDFRPAGMRPTDVARELVEGVPDARVHRLPEHAVAAVPVREHVGVRAAGVQADGRGKARAVAADFEVRDHVVDADQRHVYSLGERSRCGADDAQARAEAGPTGERHCIDFAVALVEDGLHDRRNRRPHVLGGLARVDAAALWRVRVGFDDDRISLGIVQRRARTPRSALDSENPHLPGQSHSV